jgi:glycosyltransferase involved in cell wall biosynthesis
MSSISVIIITRNEAERIRRCLESVTWVDEIVVLDSGSEDDTLAICREYTDKVIVNQDWKGFGVQKNRVLDMATSDWVLSIDADEVVSPELATEIQLAIQGESQVFEIPRVSRFCGREIRYGAGYRDYVTRLFPRSAARFTDDLVHEKLVHSCKLEQLNAPLDHNSTPNLENALEKMNAYSSAGARMKYLQGRRSGLLSAIGHGVWAFVRIYIFRYGFLDGKEGFILAVANAEGSYYRYLKLMYLHDNGQEPPKT